MAEAEEWRPGSFTKNFSWGDGNGLRELYDVIRTGFDGKLVDTPRSVFRSRVKETNRPDYIPINFFLFNRPAGDVDYLIADELVFQALSFDHSDRFDQLALTAFLISMVWVWSGAEWYQRRPAMWAHRYVADRVAKTFQWNTSKINADDIQHFIVSDPRYTGKTTRKLSTNLNYLFGVGGLRKMTSKKVDRWWVDAAFLTLDRSIENSRQEGRPALESDLSELLDASGFNDIAGPKSTEKSLALRHVANLYSACGARARFNEEHVRERAQMQLIDIQQWLANSDEPVVALHPSNVRIAKTIPRPCAMLAQLAGFFTIDLRSFDEVDFADLVRKNLESALGRLRAQGVHPTMSAEQLMKLVRGE
jgi:hypothetical protein